MLERVDFSTKNLELDTRFRGNLDIIEKDLHRTMAELGYFRKGGFLY